jgi:hypothetical protein
MNVQLAVRLRVSGEPGTDVIPKLFPEILRTSIFEKAVHYSEIITFSFLFTD